MVGQPLAHLLLLFRSPFVEAADGLRGHVFPRQLFPAQHAQHTLGERLQFVFPGYTATGAIHPTAACTAATSRAECAMPPVISSASTRPSSTVAIAPISLAIW